MTELIMLYVVAGLVCALADLMEFRCENRTEDYLFPTILTVVFSVFAWPIIVLCYILYKLTR
jgi:hypothetical protein